MTMYYSRDTEKIVWFVVSFGADKIREIGVSMRGDLEAADSAADRYGIAIAYNLLFVAARGHYAEWDWAIGVSIVVDVEAATGGADGWESLSGKYLYEWVGDIELVICAHEFGVSMVGEVEGKWCGADVRQ